jgi:hypothetical protein
MSVYGQGFDITIVAGADISAKQYQPVGITGILGTTADTFFGILQNKPQAGEHATVRTSGLSKIYMSVSLGAGGLFMGHNTTSGFIALATSGYCAAGQIFIAAESGGYGTAYLFGGAVKRLLA